MAEKAKISPRQKAIAEAIIASILWSTGGLLIKLVDWNPVAISGARSFFASLALLLYIKKPKFTKSKTQTIGTIAYAISLISFVVATKWTTSANAILLQFTSPIFVAIIGATVLKEKVYWFDITSIIVVFLGMGLFFIDGMGGGSTAGNLVAILAGFTVAISTLSFKLEKDGSAIEITLFGNILVFLISIPFMLQSMPDLRSIIILVIMGVFQLGVPYIFYVNSMKELSALEAILITVIEPLLNPVWAFIFIKENPGIYAVIGGIIVICAIVFRNIVSMKKFYSSHE